MHQTGLHDKSARVVPHTHNTQHTHTPGVRRAHRFVNMGSETPGVLYDHSERIGARAVQDTPSLWQQGQKGRRKEKR